MIILWISWKKWLQVRTFTFLDWCAHSCKLYFSTVPEHFINKREIPHCQWGWTVSHPHFYFTPADWTFLPSISPFSVTKRACSHAYTHAHRLHSLLLLASCNAKMPRSKMFFFFFPKQQQQPHLDLWNFNLGWFPSFSLWPSRHLWTSCIYTMTSNHSWKSDSLGIMNND